MCVAENADRQPSKSTDMTPALASDTLSSTRATLTLIGPERKRWRRIQMQLRLHIQAASGATSRGYLRAPEE